MGKKSRRNKGGGGGGNVSAAVAAASAAVAQQPPSDEPLPPLPQVNLSSLLMEYTSDGPSDIELLKTTSLSLQNKLNQLTQLGLVDNNRKEFVYQFVPLDLSKDDTEAYLQDLTIANGQESESQWINLISEIAAIRSGKGVTKITGDQITRTTFHFIHPLYPKCDREVTFTCNNQEWRAEG